MLPNSDVWGLPAAWLDTPSLPVTGANPDLKCSNPKSTNFGDNTCTLLKGDEAGKTIINLDLDPTICPCGQDPLVSCFGKRDYYINTQATSPTLVRTVTESDPVNWFIFSGGTDAGAGVPDYNGGEYTKAYNRWSPDAVFENNLHRLVCPVVYWELKSILLRIEVRCITADYTNYPTQLAWRTLDEWKTSHSDEKIIEVRFWFETTNASSVPNNTITYRNHTAASSKTLHGIGLLSNQVDAYAIRDVLDYTAYNRKQYSCIDIIGSWLHGNYYKTEITRVIMHKDTVKFPGIDDKSYVTTNTDRGWLYWYEIPYSSTAYESILKMAACFGCPFTPTDKLTFNADYLDEDLYLPIIDDEGIAHGQYTRGTGNIANDLYNAGSIRDKDYVPSKDTDKNTYSNITGFNSISGGASMTRRYVLDKANVDTLSDDLWTISSELATVQGNVDYNNFEAKVIDNFLVTSPIDCIVSLKRFPFDVPHTFSNTKELVKLGKNTATAQGYATYNVFNTVQFAGVNINQRFGGCFLDYEPYTQYELYVPFCGTTPLQAADIIGHTLNVRLQIDLLTGTCTAYIMADSLVIETLTGSVACDLQVTGTDTTYMNGAIVNSITNARNAKTQQEVTKTSVFSPSGLIGSVLNPWKTAGNITQAKTNRYQADYDLQHIQTPLHSMGTASALTGWYQEFNARLMIYYPMGDAVISSVPPELADLTSYGHTTGFATVENKTLSNFTGLTVCSDVDLSGISQATAAEKDMIYNALTGGIYI